MDDDLNMPVALAAIFDFMSEINKHFTELNKNDAESILEIMEKFNSVLAIFPEEKNQELTDEQRKLIDDRQKARLEKNWALADELKKKLIEQGIEIKDTPQGPIWKII